MPHSGPRNGQGRAEHEHARRQHVAPRRAERERGRDCGRGRDRAVRAGRGRGRVSAVRAGARGHDRGNRVVRVRVGRILRRGARRGRAFVWAVWAVRGVVEREDIYGRFIMLVIKETMQKWRHTVVLPQALVLHSVCRGHLSPESQVLCFELT